MKTIVSVVDVLFFITFVFVDDVSKWCFLGEIILVYFILF